MLSSDFMQYFVSLSSDLNKYFCISKRYGCVALITLIIIKPTEMSRAALL